MRTGILAHSFSSAFAIYKAVEDLPGQDVFIILSPSPHRSTLTSHLANLARLVHSSLKGFDSKPLPTFRERKTDSPPRSSSRSGVSRDT